MPNIGLSDIQDFEAKVQFALMVVPIARVTEIIRQFGDNLTSVTLEAWKTGKNRPSKTKLDLFCRALGLDLADMYADFAEYVETMCRIHEISDRTRDIYLKRIEEKKTGSIKLSVFSHYDATYTQRLFDKISGNYILYNYSINNVPEINMALISVECECHPFIRVKVRSYRENTVLGYSGSIFPVRSNLHFILETDSETYDEVVMIVTNNPVDVGRDVKFLYGMILAGSEDFVPHPSAARVFLEKMPEEMTPEQVLEKIENTRHEDIPEICRKLISNDNLKERGDFVLRAEQLNMAYIERLMQGGK